MADTAKINIGIDAKALEALIKNFNEATAKLNDSLKKGQKAREKDDEAAVAKLEDKKNKEHFKRIQASADAAAKLEKQRNKQLQADEKLEEKKNRENEKRIKAEEVAADRLSRQKNKDLQALVDASAKLEAQKARSAKQIADFERKTANEVAAIKAKQLSNQQGLLRTAGFGFQAMGFEKTGYLLRGMAQMGGLAGAMGALTIPVALAGAGLYVLADIVKNVAGAFTGAITELGKAQSLQQMIVSAAHGEYSAAQIAGRTGETTEEVLSGAQRLSKGSAHSTNDIIGWENSYLKRAGGRSTDFTNLGSLPTDLKDLGVNEPGELLGMLREEHPDLTAKQLKQVSASLYNLSAQGGFDINSEAGLRDTIAMAKNARRDTPTGIVVQSGITQLLSSVGDKAQGVKLSRLEEKLLQHPDKFSSLGNYLKKNEDGSVRFVNIEKTFADLAVQASTGKLAKGELSDREAIAMKEVGERYNNDAEAIKKHIEELENGTEALKQLDDAIGKVHDTPEHKLSVAFNELYLALAPGLLDALKHLTPTLLEWTKALSTEDGINAIKTFIQAIKDLSDIIEGTVTFIAKATNQIVKHPVASVAAGVAAVAGGIVAGPVGAVGAGAVTYAVGAVVEDSIGPHLSEKNENKMYEHQTTQTVLMTKIEKNTRPRTNAPTASSTGQ